MRDMELTVKEEEIKKALDAICEDIKEMLLRKRRDYGSWNIKLTGGELGLTVRVIDKAMRLHNFNLASVIESRQRHDGSHQHVENESLEDTWRDLVGYGLIGLVERKGMKW